MNAKVREGADGLHYSNSYDIGAAMFAQQKASDELSAVATMFRLSASATLKRRDDYPLRRCAEGATPTIRLNALLNAASEL